MVTALSTLAYLDPGDSGTPVWQWVALGVMGLVVLLAVVWALVRFVVWTARR